jgi:hypothetical protein
MHIAQAAPLYESVPPSDTAAPNRSSLPSLKNW